MTASPDGDPVFVAIGRGDTTWRFEREFLSSNWRCLFGDGCKGILPTDAEELQQGCCSLGAHFGDDEAGRAESRAISAYVAMLTPDRWQYHDVGTTDHRPPSSADARTADDGATVAGFYGDAERSHTRVVDGACIFLNRPGFAGGAGCALHLAALDAGDSPVEWKPSVCWQLPLRVEWSLDDPSDPDGPETATVRRWSRTDWGDHGRTMAWCCTERDDGGEAYSGDGRVVDTMADELAEIAGDDVVVELRRRLDTLS